MKANHSIPFTGERMVPGGALNVFFQEHFERYQFARQFIAGKTVLDAGCGEGYGPDYLAEVAREVVGIDNSLDAVHNAESRYQRSNLRFMLMDATKTQFADGIFDVVCAFEILEHIPDYQDFVAEMKRVLAPGGLFIVSTPNKALQSPGQKTRSPYHFREFYLDEFADLLTSYFPQVETFGQPPNGLFSQLYIAVSSRLDLSRLKLLLLLTQKSLLLVSRLMPGETNSPIEMAKKRECTISPDKLAGALCFVAVCQK
jgi:SAM-dependent methyltransferase